MVKIDGDYTSAKIMTDDVEDYAVAQIKQLCDLECMKEANIVCMPDIHPGKVSTIGFTCRLPKYSPIMPAIVGNDIGCGMTTAKLKLKRKPEWKKLDTVIRDNIPVGNHKRNSNHRYYDTWVNHVKYIIGASMRNPKMSTSLGSLGGGNHFIEIDVDENNEYYLTVHSGSRSLGTLIYDYWLDIADFNVNGNGIGRKVAKELCFLSDPEDISGYLHDVEAAILFAAYSRLAIIDDICDLMKWDYENGCVLDTIHNYIDTKIGHGDESDDIIIRKGAIECIVDEIVIPINMKDGILICTGKPSKEYNYSAPHGAGRILARKQVAEQHTLSEYKTIMNGIYSPTISKDTLDEAPFAYRSLEQMLPELEKIVNVEKILKPVYNYKGGSK